MAKVAPLLCIRLLESEFEWKLPWNCTKGNVNSKENMQLYTTVTLFLEISEINYCSILKKESYLTYENVPTMSWMQSTEISGELLFLQLLDSFLEI